MNVDRAVLDRLRKCARNGFELLKGKGDTFDYVDLEKLDMASPSSCILGQRSGSYYEELRGLGIDSMGLDPMRYGFAGSVHSEYSLLGAVWAELIREERVMAELEQSMEEVYA